MSVEVAPVLDMTVPPAGVRSAPKTVEISVTGRCNLTCQYCFYADEMVALSDLPTERRAFAAPGLAVPPGDQRGAAAARDSAGGSAQL